MKVLDASALLAMLMEEPGAETVRRALDGGRVSAANWSEVASKVLQHKAPWEQLATGLLASGLRVEPMGRDDGEAAALLGVRHGGLGLSLADRACLALALRLGVPALTADHIWLQVKGVQVESIR